MVKNLHKPRISGTLRGVKGHFRQKDHRLALGLAFLGDRLRNWQTWRPYFAPSAYVRQGKLFLPHLDEVIDLPPQLTAFFELMVERPEELIPHEEVEYAVWGSGIVTADMRSQLLKRARELLGESASSPTYLITHRGKGIEFRPYGDQGR